MNIMAIAGDAGGARSLIPVLRTLRSRGHQVRCRGYAAAPAIWKSEMKEFVIEPIEPISIDGIDALFTATSVQPEMWEIHYIQAAQYRRIPSLSFVESWANYHQRFEGADKTRVLPRLIAVPDAYAREGMINDGFLPEILHITGHPGLDDLKPLGMDEKKSAKRDLCKALGIDFEEDTKQILFVGQPLSQISSREVWGFDEHEAWPQIVASLDHAFSARRETGRLIVKPHPRESPSAYNTWPPHSSFIRPYVVEDPTVLPRRAAAAGDLVVGFNSILLLEAAMMKIPVISYQPNLRIPDALPSNHWGISRPIFHLKDLDKAFAEELWDASAADQRKAAYRHLPLHEQAAVRLANLIEELPTEVPL